MNLRANVGTAILVAVLFASPEAAAQVFTHEHLLEDARQVSQLIESAHPDPYIQGGGKIAYHLRLQELLYAFDLAARPPEGSLRSGPSRRLSPVDSKTSIGAVD